jgi:polar amino acid transport system substrate-binding protein
MKKMILNIVILSSMVLTCFAETGPTELLYMTENYPPANFKDEFGILTGASVDIIKAIWKEMESPEQNIKLYPWARGYNNLKTLDNHVLFSMSRTSERENMFKWVGPIFTSRHIIVGVKKENTNKIIINNVEELSKYRVGVIRDDISEETMRKIGFPDEQMHKVSQLKQSIELLLAGRVNLMFMSDEALRELIKQHGLDEDFYVAYTINYRGNYFAFSKNVSDDLILKFQNALDAIEETHFKILKESNMELYKEGVEKK